MRGMRWKEDVGKERKKAKEKLRTYKNFQKSAPVILVANITNVYNYEQRTGTMIIHHNYYYKKSLVSVCTTLVTLAII